MLLEKLRTRSREESGFTLVELLVVMLILGILAAIAIPAFFNQRDKAKDAQTKTTARTAQTAMETYATDAGGTYVGATEALLKGIEPTLNGNTITLTTLAQKTYKLAITNSDTTNTFTIERLSTGVVEYKCTTVGKAGCPTSGNWAT